MSKRSRRERREGQIARAVEAADTGTLAALSEKNPELAAQQVARALAAPSEGDAAFAELERLAESLSERLRLSGKPGPALTLAAAGRRRTPLLRMQEALAAFATGRDDVAAEIASGDSAIAAVLGPVLDAVKGVETPAPRGVAAGRVPGAVRALHAVARAVAGAVQGTPDKARATLRRIDRASQAGVLAAEMGLAVDVTDGDRALDAVDRLAASRLCADHEELRRALVGEATAHRDPEMVGVLVEHLPRHEAEIRRAGAGAEAAGLAVAEPGAAATIVRRIGAEAFAGPERPRAFLYQGFGALGDDAREASRSFDRAIDLGGDLVEALRGKLINARHVAAETLPETPARDRAVRDLASAADRLGRALAHDPAARALAAAAEVEASTTWILADDDRAALASIERGRRVATGSLRERLDEIEIGAVALRDPGRAAKLSAELTAQRPGSLDAWRLRIGLADRRGHEEERAGLVVEAAEATRDPELVAEARAIRAARGQIQPFEGLVAGAVSAGALAGELARTASKERDLGAMVRPFRGALAPEAQLALDAAVIAIASLVHEDEPRGLDRYVQAALHAWQKDPDALRKLSAVAAVAEAEEAVVRAARTMADDTRALVALVEGLASYSATRGALRILTHAAAGLSRSEVTRLRALARRGGDEESAAEGVVRALDRALAPGFSLVDYLGIDDGDDFEDVGDVMLPPEAVIPMVMEMMGVRGDPFAKLPPDERRRVEQKLMEIVAQGPSDENIDAITKILRDLGAVPRLGREGHPSSPFGPMPPGPRRRKR